MKKTLVLAAVLLAFGALQATAQITFPTIPTINIPTVTLAKAPVHYDPYYVLPGAKGSIGVDAGILSYDVSSIADASDVFAMGKYSITDKIEAGARVTLGFLREDGDAFSSALVGAKYLVTEKSAATANVLIPVGEVEDPGISVGYMQSVMAGSICIDSHLQVGLLDGYTGGTGVNIDLLVEPSKAINDKLTAYLDVLVSTNTDDIAGDYLGINLLPYVDYAIQEGLVVSAGVSIGVAGDAKQDDIGIKVAAIKTMSK